jgi:outer membrane protein OmpA-like peptidoglycan-associated protein
LGWVNAAKKTATLATRRCVHAVAPTLPDKGGGRLAAFALLLALLVLSACGTPKNYVVLLPDPEGKPSALTLTTDRGAASIEKPGEAVGASAKGSAPARIELSAEQLQAAASLAARAPKPSDRFLLNFNFGATTLTPESRELLPKILDAIGRRPAPELTVIGHTDQAGAPDYNYRLGLRRAELVRAEVIAIGVDPAMVEVTSHGANSPLVARRPGQPEAQNRRVEVTVR